MADSCEHSPSNLNLNLHSKTCSRSAVGQKRDRACHRSSTGIGAAPSTTRFHGRGSGVPPPTLTEQQMSLMYRSFSFPFRPFRTSRDKTYRLLSPYLILSSYDTSFMTKPDPLLRLLIHAYLFGYHFSGHTILSLLPLDAIFSMDALDYSVSFSVLCSYILSRI